MPPVTQPADKTAAGFTFYHGYLSVVYGLVATDGLEQLGEIAGWRFRAPPSLLLFLGVFVIGFHFWFVCSTVDESSHRFYRAFAGDKWAYLFFFVDAIIATSFAWLVLAMFYGISSGRTVLFEWFLVAAAVSLAYDLYSWALVSAARARTSSEDLRAFTPSYGTTVKCWLIQDSAFLFGALLLFLLDRYQRGPAHGLDICFVAVSIGVLVLDVKFLPVAETSASSQEPK